MQIKQVNQAIKTDLFVCIIFSYQKVVEYSILQT